MDIPDMNFEQIRKEQIIGLQHKDFNVLLNCALKLAERYNADRQCVQEAAFFLGRVGDRERFDSMVYGAYLKFPPSARPPRSFKQEEQFFDLGQKYPFLDDKEIDFLEDLYCHPGTYDMMSRILFDADELLRRKLARFNEDDFNIHNEYFSRKLCLDVFDALIKNEMELNVQEALTARHQSFDDMIAEARLYGFTPKLKYDPIWVYNRRTNTIQIDTTDLSDPFLFPISYFSFSWAGLKLNDVIQLCIEEFGTAFEDKIFQAIEKKISLSKKQIETMAFSAYCYLEIENTIKKEKDAGIAGTRLLKIRETISRKWLEYQNQKDLR